MNIIKRFSVFIKGVANLDGHLDTDAAERSIRNNIEFKGPNAWILAVAIIIASVGLNVNSTPVIIGAMLISPLMGPIFGLGLGLGINDINLLKQAGKNLIVMVSISLAVSMLYFLITPLSLNDPTEILARTKPTIFDVLIALFGGFAGIFEQCRKEKGTVFSGVAIATALMPPLCTAGFGLATGNLSYFFGAIYLFCINCLFITLATYFLVRYFRFKKTEYADESFSRKIQRITSIVILVFLVPSIWSAVILIKENNFEKRAIEFVETYGSVGNSIIYDYKIDHKDGSVLKIYLTGETLNSSTKGNLLAYAKEYGIDQEQLIIKEHGTQNPSQNEDMFRDLYIKLDSEIDKHEQTIEELTRELQEAKKADLPYLQLANEIAASYPEVKHVYIGQGAQIALDSLSATPYIYVKIQTETLMSSTTLSQLKNWIQVRLQVEEVLIDNIAIK